MNNRIKGSIGEEEALNFLTKKGYKLVAKNWHYSKQAEIDLIMLDGDTLVFIEVKTRANTNYGHPFEAITHQKLKNIRLAIQGFLDQHNDLKYTKYRIDGVAIIKDLSSIEHLRNLC